MTAVLVNSGCYSRTPSTNIYISQLWKLEVQDQGASMVGFEVRTLSWFRDDCLPAVSSLINRKFSSSDKGTNPIL